MGNCCAGPKDHNRSRSQKLLRGRGQSVKFHICSLSCIRTCPLWRGRRLSINQIWSAARILAWQVCSSSSIRVTGLIDRTCQATGGRWRHDDFRVPRTSGWRREGHPRPPRRRLFRHERTWRRGRMGRPDDRTREPGGRESSARERLKRTPAWRSPSPRSRTRPLCPGRPASGPLRSRRTAARGRGGRCRGSRTGRG